MARVSLDASVHRSESAFTDLPKLNFCPHLGKYYFFLPSLIYRISISVNLLPSSQTLKQWHILNLSLTFILCTHEKHEYSKHYEKIRTQVFYRQGNRWKIEKKLESTISIQWKTESEEYSYVSVIKGTLKEWTLKNRELLNSHCVCKNVLCVW